MALVIKHLLFSRKIPYTKKKLNCATFPYENNSFLSIISAIQVNTEEKKKKKKSLF